MRHVALDRPGGFTERDTLLAARDEAPGMAARGFGGIVKVTSGAVTAPVNILGLSNGARCRLTGFVAGLARQPHLASRNGTINNLLPGGSETDRLRATLRCSAAKTDSTPEAVAQARLQGVPVRRLGAPAEFSALCAFVCSAHAGYLTGAEPADRRRGGSGHVLTRRRLRAPRLRAGVGVDESDSSLATLHGRATKLRPINGLRQWRGNCFSMTLVNPEGS